MAEWQPIETAPKDEPVLAWWPHLERPVIAWISRGGSSIGKWTFASHRFEVLTPVVAPTHWQPLPEPPGRSVRVTDLSETELEAIRTATPREEA